MKYAIKAEDGFYKRWPGECGSSQNTDAGWNAWLEDADLYSSREEAEYALSEGFGKWARGKAVIVAVTVVECEDEPKECGEHYKHDYTYSKYCGCEVCDRCDHHKGLARCYCGWSASGDDGRAELEEMGETIDPDY